MIKFDTTSVIYSDDICFKIVNDFGSAPDHTNTIIKLYVIRNKVWNQFD